MSRRTAFAVLVALSLATPALAEIVVHDAYARSSGAMATAGAAFMVIRNEGGPDDRLIDVRSDAAERVELHTHIADSDGVMRMVHVEEGFELPAGGEIRMQRGSHHVMFMGLTDPFEQDETLTVTLVFEQAGEVVIEVPVDQERNDMMPAMDHGAMGGN